MFKENKMKRKIKLNTPSILQIEAAECGAASLGIILGYYGKYLSLEKLREDCGVSKDGSKASNIVKAARIYGLEAVGYRKEPHEIKEMKFPLIVHWNFNHFLVVEGYDKNYFYLNDPALGKRKITIEEFDLAFTGIVIEFQKSEKFIKNKRENSMKVEIMGSVLKYREIIFFLSIIGIFVTIPGIIIPVFTKVFIDEIILKHYSNWLFPVLLGLFITIVFKALFLFLQGKYILKLEHKISVVSSAKFFHHLLKLPINYFYQRFAGEISQVMELNEEYSKIVVGKLVSVFINMIFLVFYIIVMCIFSIKLTAAVIIVTILNFISLYLITKKRNIYNQKMLIDSGKLYGVSIAGIQMIETLKSTGRESEFFSKWSGHHSKLISGSSKTDFLNEVLIIVPQFFYTMGFVIIISIGAFDIIEGILTIGTLVSFQVIFSNFFEPVEELMKVAGEFQDAISYKQKIDDVLRNKVDERFEETNENKDEYQMTTGKIEIKNISYGYSKLSPQVISNVNISAEYGEHIGIIGKSGSGKSTIAKLIAGLYHPWSGEIIYNGKKIELYSREELSVDIAFVDQNLVIYEGTISENITMFNSEISREDIVRAAKIANIHDDIMKLKNGYETKLIENGRNISGGQKQRIEIARALLKNPIILILDEATSALDNIVEKKIMENILQYGITVITIAQRIETIKNCNKIYVIENGEVVNSGNFDFLEKNCNFVKEII